MAQRKNKKKGWSSTVRSNDGLYGGFSTMEIIETIESKIFDNLITSIYEQREQIITAFIAQHGCKPDEIEQVVQYTGDTIRWFIRKKSV